MAKLSRWTSTYPTDRFYILDVRILAGADFLTVVIMPFFPARVDQYSERVKVKCYIDIAFWILRVGRQRSYPARTTPAGSQLGSAIPPIPTKISNHGIPTIFFRISFEFEFQIQIHSSK